MCGEQKLFKVKKKLLEYLDGESIRVKAHFETNSWSAEYKITTQQDNTYDCGMFVIMRIFSISCGEDVNTFTQKDMKFCCNRLIIELMKEQIDDY